MSFTVYDDFPRQPKPKKPHKRKHRLRAKHFKDAVKKWYSDFIFNQNTATQESRERKPGTGV